MMLSPFTLFGLLLAGAVVSAILAYFTPHLLHESAGGRVAGVAVGGLALLIWLAMGFRLPLLVTLSEWPAAALLPPWNWRLDEIAWQLSGVVLLLMAAALLVASSKGQETSRNRPAAAYYLLLAAATLTALWADSLAGLMAGWMLLAIVWALTLFQAGHFRAEAALVLPGVGWLLLAVLALWLAAAAAPPATTLAMDAWPAVATMAVLVAAVLQMGVWPLAGWRPIAGGQLSPAMAALIHTMPTVAGAHLLARLAAGGGIGLTAGLILTAIGLLGFLRGVRLAWGYLRRPARMVATLALVQTSVVLLAGVWAGPAAVVAEVRILVLATGTLFLMIDGRPLTRAHWWRALGPAIALAALAGLPLTAGFAGRSALYDAWLANSRFVLVLVAGLLHIPLIAAVLLLLKPRDEASSAKALTPGDAIGEAGLLLPALGMLSLNGLGQASLVSWLAVLAAAAGGFLLLRFIGEVREARTALRQAFSVNLPVAAAGAMLARLAQGLKGAVGEATLILEGEGGLLWLLVLVVVFLLAL